MLIWSGTALPSCSVCTSLLSLRVLCRHHLPTRGKHLLFEFTETASPHTREPLTDRVQRLAREAACPELLSLRSCDLHPQSWFAVAWYPLYRIPAGCCLRELSACFLTFHSMGLPAASLPLHATLLPKRGFQGGMPPHKLSPAEVDLPLPHPAVAAALAPALEQRRLAAAQLMGPGLLARHPMTFLTPFACMPYKAPVRPQLRATFHALHLCVTPQDTHQAAYCGLQLQVPDSILISSSHV